MIRLTIRPKQIKKVLTYFFAIVWLVMFVICALLLKEGKYLTVSYAFVGISLTCAGALYNIGLINKEL